MGNQNNNKTEKLFYIQDVDRGYVGNSLMWWKHNDCGYVCDIREAKIWTEEEAIQQCRSVDNLRMWEKEYIDARVQHHIDMQTIDWRDPKSHSKQYDYENQKWR